MEQGCGQALYEPEDDADCPFANLAAELFGNDEDGNQSPVTYKSTTLERSPTHWRISVLHNGKGQGGDFSAEYERRYDAMHYLKLWARKRFPCPVVAAGPGAGSEG